MTLNDVIFIDRYPKLDLHGYDRETARVALLDFIKEHKKLQDEVIVIVHGRGSGVLKNMTFEVLKKSRNIAEFKTYYYNDGCTIARIFKECEKNVKKNLT